MDANLPTTTGSEAPSYAAAIFAPFFDAWLTGRARLAMLATCGSDAGNVSVEAYHGRLVLAGDVPSHHVHAQVEEAVRDIAGVSGVSNRIRVRGADPRRRGGSDAEILAAVAMRLRARDLRASAIRVASVYDGVVTLAGTARSGSASELAFDLATHVVGVRRVINDVVLGLVSQSHTGAGQDADAA